MKEKVVLAYSGGLDTTALIPWLKENFDYEVICCCINCGQGKELDGLAERAAMSGAAIGAAFTEDGLPVLRRRNRTALKCGSSRR